MDQAPMNLTPVMRDNLIIDRNLREIYLLPGGGWTRVTGKPEMSNTLTFVALQNNDPIELQTQWEALVETGQILRVSTLNVRAVTRQEFKRASRIGQRVDSHEYLIERIRELKKQA